MFVEFVVALLPFGTCIAYAVLIADFIPAAIQAFQATDSFAAGRTSITLIVGCCVLFPLCLLRNLSSLKFSSVAGVVSMVFASCVIISAIVDHTPNNLPVSAIARFDGGLFTAMSLISVAFTMHYNAQRYYQELADRSLQRIGRIIFGSFLFAFLLYAFVGIFGVLEFDTDVQSNVINNFLPSPLINTTRVFLSLAIIASFPLPFHGCRSNFLRLFFRLEGDDLPTSRWVIRPLLCRVFSSCVGSHRYFCSLRNSAPTLLLLIQALAGYLHLRTLRSHHRHLSCYRQCRRRFEFQGILPVLSRCIYNSRAGLHQAHAALWFQGTFWTFAARCLWSRCRSAHTTA
jgi:amino acid permease